MTSQQWFLIENETDYNKATARLEEIIEAKKVPMHIRNTNQLTLQTNMEIKGL